MNLERTLSIIKPDATEKNLSGNIISIIEREKFKILAQKKLCLTARQAEKFYNVHSERAFYRDLVEFMISGSIIVQVLESVNAVDKYRELMGSTNPKEAKEGTLRALFGESIQCNAVHGSDSKENAEKEIRFFFSDIEIVN